MVKHHRDMPGGGPQAVDVTLTFAARDWDSAKEIAWAVQEALNDVQEVRRFCVTWTPRWADDVDGAPGSEASSRVDEPDGIGAADVREGFPP